MVLSLTRRELSALAVPLLAGCISSSNANESDGNESDGDQPDLPPCTTSIGSPDPYPDIEIESDTLPDDANVHICVTPIEPFTDDSPAKIAVELTNVSDSSAKYGFGISPPWGGVFAEHAQQEATLILVPDYREHVGSEELIPQRATDGCWRAQTPYSGEDIGLTASVDPAETLREEYTILAAEGSACFTPGTYRSEQEHYEPVPGVWGFDLTLSQ